MGFWQANYGKYGNQKIKKMAKNGNKGKVTMKEEKITSILCYLHPKKIPNLLTSSNLYDIMIANKYG